MAHRFDNFDDAFAAWSGRYATIKTHWANTNTNMNLAYTGCPDPVDRTHFYHMYAALQSIQLFLTALTNHSWPTSEQSDFYESMYWAGQTEAVAEPYELTLVKMIEAYINADDDHRSGHRLLLDAYQASMYDKPFDQEYHAAWIQRFRSWV